MQEALNISKSRKNMLSKLKVMGMTGGSIGGIGAGMYEAPRIYNALFGS